MSSFKESKIPFRSGEGFVRKQRYYTIGAVAKMYGLHPQTLRLYDREGLLKPSRTSGNKRFYSQDDVDKLEMILRLTRELGVNKAGAEIILDMRKRVEEYQQAIKEMLMIIRQEFASEVADADARIKEALKKNSRYKNIFGDPEIFNIEPTEEIEQNEQRKRRKGCTPNLS
jgi:MerR family transcriptional regulator, heat shock protein HspR